MKFVLLLVCFLGVYSLTLDTTNKCKCNEIKNMNDCNVDCFWNQAAQKCIDPPINFIRTGYCSIVGIVKCNQTLGCGNYYGICIPFTGCTTITYNTNFGCQQYSTRCITDGSKCVELGTCSSYTSRFSCRNNYENGVWVGYCYWDKNECRSPKNCNELPASLKNDAECRAQMKECTYKSLGGCIQSGQQCYNQKSYDQCITNKAGTIKCYWDGSACFEYSCKFITQDCIKMGCSIDENSNCIDRGSCTQYKNQISCTYDTNNNLCMWEGNTCAIKSCSNASLTRNTNLLCQQISNTCITKFGGGCQDNGECEVATNKISCVYNIRGEQCYWNGYQCVLKQCQWAPLSYQSAAQCSNFMGTCVYNGKKCVEKGCYGLTTQQVCTQNTKCRWQKKCDIKSCDTAGKDIYHISHTDCNSYLNECTVADSGIGCMRIKYSCSTYSERQCYLSTTSKCSWVKGACVARKCDYGILTTHSDCNNFLNGCTSDGIKCISVANKCSLYINQTSCVIDINNNACIWNNNKCTQMLCSQIPHTIDYNTHDKCNAYINQCTVIEKVQGCQKYPDTCDLYTQDQCNNQKCVYSGGVCRSRVCSDYYGSVTQSFCENYLPNAQCMKEPGLYPKSCEIKPENCDKIKNEYQCLTDINNIECTWYQLKCETKSCTNIEQVSIKTDIICKTWLPSCIADTSVKCKLNTEWVNTICSNYLTDKYCSQQNQCYWTSINTCANKVISCDQLSQNDCPTTYLLNGNQCSWSTTENKCVDRCTLLIPQNNSCQVLNSKCIIQSNLSKCISKKPCNNFSTEVDCKSNNTNPTIDDVCTWNLSQCQVVCSNYPSQKVCVDDNDCRWDSITGCENRDCPDITDIASTNNTCNAYLASCTVSYPGGCTDLKVSCTDYDFQIQCKVNTKGQKCYWNKTSSCVDKKCENADINVNTQSCATFFTDLECVINSAQNGCMALISDCTNYTNSYQCVKQSNGQNCYWDSVKTKCVLGTCSTISLSVYNHENCLSGLTQKICTVNQTFDGCIELGKDCSSYFFQEQCYITNNNVQCIWEQNQCKTKTCFDDVDTSIACSDYLSTCTETAFQCREVVCEDYLYENDDLCKQVNAQCTSNGRHCILRGTCEQNNYQAACISDYQGKLCGWTSKGCVYITCNDAPLTFQKDEQCKEAFPNEKCVTKLGGGCNPIYSCADYTIQKSCIDNKCTWENELCREQKCSDFKSQSYSDCNSKLNDCTTDGNQCVSLQQCSMLSKSLCIYGIEGPCLYVNQQCYAYTECESIPFKDHKNCYDNLQQQCTSNGQTCIPITVCKEYKNQISCILGVDGATCAWLPTGCDVFTSCEKYTYKTHDQCQSINSKCTTDTVNGCIFLQPCSKYSNQENCKLNNVGQIIQNGLVTSIGTCLWNGSQCSDSGCSSISGSTHANCYKQLSKCTSDGIKCIDILKCSQYASINSCVMGTDGDCMFNSTNQICQLLDCTTLTTQTDCQNHSICQYVNQLCQPLLKCADYTDTKYCTKGKDGLCTIVNSKCQLMTLCSHAQSSSICSSKTCYWNSTSSLCQDHTCTTYGTYYSCGSFYNYNQSQLTYCGQTNGTCIEVDPSIYNNTCYYLSKGYFYYYESTCTACNYIPTNNTTVQNQTNNTNTTKDDSSSNLVIAIVLLILI